MPAPFRVGAPSATKRSTRSSSHFWLRLALVPLTWTFLSSCGGSTVNGPGFSPTWQWNGGHEGRQILARLASEPAPPVVALAVGVTGRGLIGRELPSGKVWQHEGAVNVLPSISAGLVAFTGDAKLTVLDGRTGRLRYELPSGGRRLEGFGSDGARGIFLLVDEDDARPDEIVVANATGKVLTRSTTIEKVGTPGVWGKVGLVPWSYQYVTAFDLDTGAPIGRLLSRTAPNRVLSSPNGLFLSGGAGLVRVDDELARDPDKPAVRIRAPGLPGEPEWPEDGSKPRPAKAQPIRILVAAQAEPQAVTKSAYLATYYELVAGFDAQSGSLRFVTDLEKSVVGSGANTSGGVLCLEDGRIVTLSWETGSSNAITTLGARLKACTVDPGNLRARAEPRPRLEQQIATAIAGTGPDMAAFQQFLIEQLARLPSAEATAALLEVARNPMSSGGLVSRAATTLEGRTTGLELMVQALEESAPQVTVSEDGGTSVAEPRDPRGQRLETDEPRRTPSLVRPPPTGSLARALQQADIRAAASPLARHLLSPNLSAADALAVTTALLQLGGPTEAPYIREFLMTNKNVASNEQFTSALIEAARFLFRQGGTYRADTQAALEAKLTHPDLAARLRALLVEEERRSPSPPQGPLPRDATSLDL